MPPCPRIRLPLALAVALTPLAGCTPREDAPRPDVVLVSMDTVRADFLGAWGDPRGATPHLDRFARGNAQFARCISQAASTLPSHRSMFQSRPASRTADAFPMLAELLAEAGWATAGFTGGGNVAGELGFSRGFDDYAEGPDLAWSVARWAEWRGAVTGPAFAFLHGYDAHVPYDPPPPFDRLYDPGYRGPVRGADTRDLCRAVRGLEPGAAPDLTDADRRHLEALYVGGLRVADARFGGLMRRLDETPEGRGAMVVLMSDHGEELWDHGSLLHSHTVFQELVHVPLLIRLPRAAAGASAPAPSSGPEGSGRLIAGTVRNLDIAPTVLDALGLPAAGSHQGISLRSAIAGAGGGGTAPASGDAAVDSAPAAPTEMREWKALVEDRWKLISSESGRLSLYDLEADPGETTNAAPGHRDVARGMAERLAEIVEAVPVRELADDDVTDELRDRLRALGYVE